MKRPQTTLTTVMAAAALAGCAAGATRGQRVRMAYRADYVLFASRP